MNKDIAQGIFSLITIGVEYKDWQSIELNYKADEVQSEYSGSYQTPEGEKFLRLRHLSSDEQTELGELLETLRKETQEVGKEYFTHCTLRYTSDGEFNITYDYDPIDWSLTV